MRQQIEGPIASTPGKLQLSQITFFRIQYVVQKCNCDVLLAVRLRKKVSATCGMPEPRTMCIVSTINLSSFVLPDGPVFAISQAILIASNSAIDDIYIYNVSVAVPKV